MRRHLTAWIALAALGVGPVVAREAPPPVGPPRPFQLPVNSTFELDNGLSVTLVPAGAVPKVSIVLALRTGNIADGAKTGLADLTAAMLKEGAGSHNAAALSRLAADMGGALEASAGADETTIAVDVLSERASDAIALIADVVRRPRLPENELARLKSDLARQAAIARSQAQGVAGDAFAHLLWGEHPYGRTLPTEAGIASMTIADVRGFVAREFGAARAHLYIAGRFDSDAVTRAIRAQFGDWARGAPPARLPATGSRERIVKLIDRPGAQQTTLLLGLPVPGPMTPGFMSLSLANAVLGGSLLSRLNLNLREEKGWTYGVHTQIAPFAAGTASWVLETDINAPDTAPAISEIFRELERLRTEPLPAEELRATQNFRAGNFLIGASGRGGLIAQLAFCDLQNLPADWLTNYAAHVYAVTPEQLENAAASYLDPNAMTLVIVGDLAKLRPALVALPALKGASFQ
jgi:predicted Zn-dependent peptidase